MNIFSCVTHVESVPLVTNKVKQRLHLHHGESDPVDRKLIEAVAYSDARREGHLYRCIWFRRGDIRPTKAPIIPARWLGRQPYRLAVPLSVFDDNPEPPSTALGIDIA
jgi:hypothetical protein